MKLIPYPTTLAQRIVNAVVEDIYGRSGGDWWWDDLDDDVRVQEVIPELIAVVQGELDKANING